jgi:hypothetical protein
MGFFRLFQDEEMFIVGLTPPNLPLGRGGIKERTQ